MAFDLTGIHNHNEFYTHYYLTTLLEQDIRGVLGAWEASAQEAGWATPVSEIRKMNRDFFSMLQDIEQEKDAVAKLDLQTAFLSDFFSVLGYDIAPRSISLNDDFSIPVLACLNRSNGASLLWIITVLDTAQEKANPLDCSWQPFQVDGADESTIEDFVTKSIFTLDEPPRWLIVATQSQIVLIDRSKWHDKRLLSFDLSEIYARREATTFQALTVLLHKDSICPDDGIPLLDSLDENSHKHAHAVSEDLKYSLREAIEKLGNEALFYFNSKNWQGIDGITRYKKLYDSDIDAFAAQLSIECLRYMYRLLFLLYSEARPELGYAPMKSNEYRLGYSFDSLRDLEMVRLTTEESRSGFYIHESLNLLFKMIFNGYPEEDQSTAQMHVGEESDLQHHTFRIPQLRTHLFDPDQTPIIGKAQLRNSVLQDIIKLMSLSRPRGRRERRGRISYAQLGINQLGAVYEALLSYSGFLAKTELYEVKKAGESYDELKQAFFVKAEDLPKYTDDEKVFNDDGTLRKYAKGTFIYRLAGRNREKSASYYTPEVLTKCLVKYALKELLKDKTADDILKLTVCEPAMGSAAFLNEAVNQLAEAYLRKKQEETGEIITHDEYPQILQQVKMYIADENVYGVDLNPVAVELGEVSLWLNTIHKGAYVPWFGMQLVCGNSLVGARRQVFPANSLKTAKKGSETWLEAVPERVKPGEKRPAKGVYHFLVPDRGMADYKDKVIEQMAGPQINHIKDWRKEFTKAFAKGDIELLLKLSKTIDKLWQRHGEQLKRIRQKTEDPVQVWRQPEIENSHPPTTTQWKDKVLFEELYSRNVRNSSPYRRLKLVMDYWCALWFWPIEMAELLPSRDEFFMDLQLILEGNVVDIMAGSAEQTSLFPETQPRQEALKLVDEFGFVNVDELMGKIERLKVVDDLAGRYRFLHWELQFADLFEERGGFDLIVGNPPWTRIRFEAGAALSGTDPILHIRQQSSSDLMDRVFNLVKEPIALHLYFLEAIEALGSRNLFNSSYFPISRGTVTNLYKLFFELSWCVRCDDGICSLLHDSSIYDETNAGLFRSWLYHRMRYCWRFINQLNHFPEDALGHAGQFCISTLAHQSKSPEFYSMSNIFHPLTIDQSFYENQKDLPIPLIRNEKGWVLKGHPDRIILNDEASFMRIKLALNLPEQPFEIPLLAIYAKPLLRYLESIEDESPLQEFVGNLNGNALFDENASLKRKILSKTPHWPESVGECILSAPHFYVGYPLFKVPNRACRSKGDYSNVDINNLPKNYLPRALFKPADKGALGDMLSQEDFKNLLGMNRLAWRTWVSPTNERTLITTVLPPKILHIYPVHSMPFKNVNFLLATYGLTSSIVYDFLMRIAGKDHIWAEDILHLPFPANREHILSEIRKIALGLVPDCDMYGQFINEAIKHDTNFIGFESISSHCDRYLALVKLDVLSAMALGLSMKDLCLLFSTQFPTLLDNARNTYYDSNGQIVRTTNRNFSKIGLPISEWERVRNKRSGTIEQEIEDDTMPGGPVKRTIVYEAPFDKCDRERDYEIAWREFERRGIGRG